MIDIRKEFNSLIENGLGRWVLIRRSTGVRCHCASSGEPNSSCKLCYGNGYLWIERPTQVYSRPDSQTDQELVARFGTESLPTHLFYLSSKVRPRLSDLLIEVKRSEETGRITLPVTRMAFYDLTDVNCYSSNQGIPEFYSAYGRDITLEIQRAPERF